MSALLSQLTGTVRDSVQGWNRFWFEAENHEQMRLFRRLLALVLLISYLIRTMDLELYYSDHGIAPLSILPDVANMNFRYSLLALFPSEKALWFFNGFFLLSLALMFMDIWPKFASIAAWVLHLSFLHRNPGCNYGADTISSYYLFFFCLADTRKSPVKGDWRYVLGSVALRLCQIQLCIIYFYAGVHKLKGNYWWRGDAVWGVMANAQMARWDFSWTAHFPLFFVFGTYSTLLFEIYFPALVWLKWTRKPFLAFGALFHVLIAVTMNIPIFAALMTFSYTMFFTPIEARRVNLFFEKIRLRIQVPRQSTEENYV